jgi:hypothetical protein
MALGRSALAWALCAIVNLAWAADGDPGQAIAPPGPMGASGGAIPPFSFDLDRGTEERILALAPGRISDAEVRTTLALAPAPRIIALQGSFAFVTMEPFAEFLIAMGYPQQRIRNPRDGSLSYSSFADSARLAGTLAWYYEREGMVPMLIGHSQGGMMAIRVLHELAGDFGHPVVVWNPLSDEVAGGTSAADPVSGVVQPVSALKVPYAAAIATGTLPRILLGQWDMVQRLHEIPDTVTEFTGYSLEWDLIAGNFGRVEPYRATGAAEVRNVTLPQGANHIRMPVAKALALDPATRAWIDAYSPSRPAAPLPDAPGVDMSNIVHAADIWYSVKKHWCLEAQRMIREHRAAAGVEP